MSAGEEFVDKYGITFGMVSVADKADKRFYQITVHRAGRSFNVKYSGPLTETAGATTLGFALTITSVVVTIAKMDYALVEGDPRWGCITREEYDEIRTEGPRIEREVRELLGPADEVWKDFLALADNAAIMWFS